MPTIDVEFEIYCSCGEGLCGQTSTNQRGDVIVEPCEKCLESAKEEGYAKGYDNRASEIEEK